MEDGIYNTLKPQSHSAIQPFIVTACLSCCQYSNCSGCFENLHTALFVNFTILSSKNGSNFLFVGVQIMCKLNFFGLEPKRKKSQ